MADDGPQPFSESERREVLEIARRNPELGQVLEGRGRVLVVEPHLAARPAPGQALVAVYDYERDRTLVAAVDRARGAVLSVDEAPAPFQLSDEERQEAEALAEEDARVKEFLGGRPMRPLTRLYFPPEGASHRHAIVFLRPNSSERRYAVIDLSERRVVDVLTRAEFTG
jgi:hypothetical protein